MVGMVVFASESGTVEGVLIWGQDTCILVLPLLLWASISCFCSRNSVDGDNGTTMMIVIAALLPLHNFYGDELK